MLGHYAALLADGLLSNDRPPMTAFSAFRGAEPVAGAEDERGMVGLRLNSTSSRDMQMLMRTALDMQMLMRTALCVALLGLPSLATAQNIELSTVRAAGSICGAGLSTDVQGDLDARIAKILGGVSAEGNTSVDIGRASDLLSSFEAGDRGEAFKTYASCVIQTVSAMTGVALAANAESDSPKPAAEVR